MRQLKLLRSITLFLLMVVALLAPSISDAHKVSVYADRLGDQGKIISGEGYFFSGAPCAGCRLTVWDELEKTKVLELKTDDKGLFDFAHPANEPLLIILEAEGGHAARFELAGIEPDEMEGINSSAQEPVTIDNNTKDIQALINAEVEAQTKPLRDEISRLRKEADEPKLSEILGGIGFIFGIFGIWMFWQSRQLNKSRANDK